MHHVQKSLESVSHGKNKMAGGCAVSTRGSGDGSKEESVSHQPRQTPDVVIVCHRALRCVRRIATVDSVDVAKAFLVAVIKG